MKYIDADKLIAEIEKQLKLDTEYGSNVYDICSELLSFITSLQQEQSEVIKTWLAKQFNLAQKCMKSAERDWERAYENGQMEAYGKVLSFLNLD